MFYIYKLYFDSSDSVYIGKTKNLTQRIYDHLAEARNKSTNTQRLNWIRKYHYELGEQLKHEILAEFDDEQACLNAEIDYIAEYKELGYQLKNSTEGGEGSSGRICTDNTKAKISKAQKGKQTWLGKKHSDETKKKISEANKGKKAWLGRKHSDETKKKLSIIKTKPNKPVKPKQAKTIEVTYPDGHIEIITNYAKWGRDNNIDKGCIMQALKRGNTIKAGYTFRYIA